MPRLRIRVALAIATTLAACRDEPSIPPADDDHLRTSIITRGPECEHCALEITLLGRLGSEADSLLMTAGSMMAVRSDGAWLVAPLARDGEAAIFDSLGAVARQYGRPGDGPGENGRILHVLPWRGDSMLFAGFDRLTFLAGDRGTGRTSRLARPSASHRTVALPAVDAVVRNYSYPPDGQFVIFDDTGTVRATSGAAWEPGARRDVYAVLAELGPARDQRQFWSAPQRYRIRIDLWDARDGSHLRSIQDSTPWFAPYDSAGLHRFILEGNDAANPPPPFLRGLRESADGVLLLLYNVPARDWAPIRDTLPPHQREMRRAAYDGVLDLRDPTSGESMLTVWTNLPFARLVNDTLLADRRQTAEGFWVYDIYRVGFRR